MGVQRYVKDTKRRFVFLAHDTITSDSLNFSIDHFD